jgi:hypothetical protein
LYRPERRDANGAAAATSTVARLAHAVRRAHSLVAWSEYTGIGPQWQPHPNHLTTRATQRPIALRRSSTARRSSSLRQAISSPRCRAPWLASAPRSRSRMTAS